MKLIVGLGNPGKEYEKTRHNIGFELIDRFAESYNFPSFKEKFKGLMSEKNIGGEKVILLKPQTFMNLSGDSVVQFVNFYKLNPKEDVAIIFDDMDLPLGKTRVKINGSSGGHNGIKSIISHIGSDFFRLKCGIGRGKDKNNTINFVLGKFSKEDMELIEPLLNIGIEAIYSFIEGVQIEKIMQKTNKK